MAKAGAILSALCIFAIATIAYSAVEEFHVVGLVYCDPCRVQFQTKLSKPIEGATVKLECKNPESNAVTYSLETKTDCNGRFNITAKGDHEEEICSIDAVSSPLPDCNVPFQWIDSSKIILTENSGIKGSERFANPLGFSSKKPIEGCMEALDEMGFVPYDIQF